MPPPMPGPGPHPGPHPGPGPRPPFFPNFPIQRYVIVQNPVRCTPVYNNQNEITALNNILSGCNSLTNQGKATCNTAFIKQVQASLTTALSVAVVIGQNCQNLNTTIGNPIVY